MQPNDSEISPDEKEGTLLALIDMMILCLEKGYMTVEESEQSAEYMLLESRKIVTSMDMLTFLRGVVDHWPQYDPIYQEALRKQLMSKVENELQEIVTGQT